MKLIVLALLGIFVLMALGSASGADIYVDTTGSDTTGDGSSGNPYATIQKGVDEASDGDTINIADGTYTEDVEIDGYGLIFSGESEAGTIVQAGATAPGSTNVFYIDTASTGYDFEFHNMTIRNGLYGIRSKEGNIEVYHCTFYHNGWDGTGRDSDPSQTEMADLWASSNTTSGGAFRLEDSSNTKILDCTVYDNLRGARLQDTSTGKVTGNTIYGNIDSGLYMASSTYTIAAGCDDVVIKNNTIYENNNNGLLLIGGHNFDVYDNEIYDNWNTGVQSWMTGELTLVNNEITGNSIYQYNGLGLLGDSYGGIDFQGSSNANEDIQAGAAFLIDMRKNVVADNNAGRYTYATGFTINNKMDDVGTKTATIKNNVFSGHEVDIWLEDHADYVAITGNSFSDATEFGVDNDDTGVEVDAENNWWGAGDGPSGEGAGSGVAVSTDVDYDPYTAAPSTVWVDDDYTATDAGGHTWGYDAFATIQGGLDVISDNATVTVAAGTYTEYVQIFNDGVTLDGAGIDQTILDLDGVEPYNQFAFQPSGYSVGGILISGYNQDDGKTYGVTVQDLTVQDAGLNSGTSWTGARDDDSNGDGDVNGISAVAAYYTTIDNVKVDGATKHGVHFDRPVTSTHSARWHCKDGSVTDSTFTNNDNSGIYFGFFHGDATITGNTVDDNFKNGIFLAGSKKDKGDNVKKYATGTINNNDVDGNSANEGSNGGIFVKAYSTDITVYENTVTGHNLWSESFGIMTGYAENTGTDIYDNTVTGNMRAIIAFYGASGGSIYGNTITTDSGTYDTGQAAIKMDGVSGFDVYNNDLSSLSGVGIMFNNWGDWAGVPGSNNNSIYQNTIDEPMFAGIYLKEDARYNTFTNNVITSVASDTFSHNHDWGTHDGANDASVLTDSTQSWTTDYFVGWTLENDDDGSSGTVTANTATTITATLSGGTEDDWDTGDSWDLWFDVTRQCGIYLEGGDSSSDMHAGPMNTFEDNSITGWTTYAVDNEITDTLDASGNWWGSYNYATVGNGMNGNVDYTPWLRSGTDTDSGTMGFQGDFTSLHVDDDSDQTGAMDIIEEGIDMVTASTVYISPGTYSEDVSIDKALTLNGPGTATGTLTGQITVTASSVTIRSFTLEVDSNEVGINIDSSGGALGTFLIQNIIFDMDTSPVVGIYVGGGATNEVSDIDIRSCTFNGPTNKICNPFKVGGGFGAPLSTPIDNLDFIDNEVNYGSIPLNLEDANLNDLLFDNNTFRNTDGLIYIWGDSSPTGVISNFVFTSNDADSTNSYGVAFGYPSGTFTASNFGTGNLIAYNDLDSIPGAYGMETVTNYMGSSVLKTEKNYWGTTDETDLVDLIVSPTTVDYSPWYDGTFTTKYWADVVAPTTTKTVTGPKYGVDDAYVRSNTTFSLSGDDGNGTGVDAIWYRIKYGTWGPWTEYSGTFSLTSGEGEYEIEFNATDNMGNVETTQSQTHTVDDTAPTVDIGGPYSGDEASAINLDASGSSDSGSGIMSYQWDLDEGGAFDDDTGSTISETWDVDGSYTVGVKVKDNLGNYATDTVGVTVNNVAPTADAGGPYEIDEGDDVDLDASGSSDPADALTYAWDIDDDGQFDDATGETPTVSWATLDSLGLNDGTHTIEVKVSDDDTFTTDTADLTINNVEPTIGLDSPTGGEQWAGTHDIEWTATDDGDTLTIDIDYWDGSGWSSIATGEENDGSYSWDTKTELDNDEAKIRVTADDGTTTVDDESGSFFEIDNTKPTTTDDYVSTWHDEDVTITLTPSDTGVGVDFTWYRIDGGDWQTGTTIDVTGDGSHTVDYGSTDLVGNNESANQIIVLIDTTAPELKVYYQNKKIKFEGSDNLDSAPDFALLSKFGKNRVYKITDHAGNTATVKLRYNKQSIAGWKIKTVRLKWISYNDGPQQSFADGTFRVQFKKSGGSIKTLKQYISGGTFWLDGKYRQSLAVTKMKIFDGTLTVDIHAGLKVGEMLTNAGMVDYNVP